MEGIIYKLTSPSGKCYIGQTIQKFNSRLSNHKYAADSNKDYPISKAIKKYGIESFKSTVIVTVNSTPEVVIKQLNKLERFFIKFYDSYKNGYNASTGGTGYILKEEYKKLKGHNTGKKASLETKEKMRNSRLGFITSKETKEKLRIKNIGRKHTPETIEKIRSIKKNLIISEETRKKMNDSMGRPILQYDKDNNFIREWRRIGEIHEHMNVKQSHINDACRGKRDTCLGYIWKYKTIIIN